MELTLELVGFQDLLFLALIQNGANITPKDHI